MVKQRGARKKTRKGALGAAPGAKKGGGAAAAGGATPPLFKKLESTDDDEREHGCLAIASLAAEGSKEIQELLRHGAIEALTLRLTDHLLRVRLAAAAAVRAMVAAGGGTVCSAILSSGMVGALVAQLQDSGQGGTGSATVTEAPEGREAALDQLLVQVILTLTLCCQSSSEAVEALTERPVLDVCLAFLRPSTADGAAAPRAPLVEMVTLLLTLVEDNPSAVAYLTQPPASAPALVLLALGQMPSAPPLLQALTASTVVSLALQQRGDPRAPLAQAVEGWAWSTLSSIATADSLGAFGAAVATPAQLVTMLPAARAQLKSLEALNDAVFEEVDGAVSSGLPLLETLLPRCLAIPDAGANAAAVGAIAAAAAQSEANNTAQAEAAATNPEGADPATAANAAAATAAGGGAQSMTMLQGGYQGFDEEGAVVSELWSLVRAVPTHACRCVANLLANEQRINGSQLESLPRSAVWEPLLAAWLATSSSVATAAAAAAAGAAAPAGNGNGDVEACELLDAITGALLAMLQRLPALAASVAASEPEVSAILQAAGAQHAKARTHALSMLAVVGVHLTSVDALVAAGTAALTSVVDGRWPAATLLAALEVLFDVFGGDQPALQPAAQKLGLAAKLSVVRSFVEQRLSAAEAEADAMQDGSASAALANYGAFVDYAAGNLG